MAKKNVKEISVKIEGKEWEIALEKAFVKANKKAKVDGFRAGKAPKDKFLKKYGIESLYMDAGDLVIESAYKKVIEENKDLELVTQPEINLKNVDEKHIEFIFTLTTKPEIKLGNYKKLKTKKEKVKVTKEEIDASISDMQSKYAENIIKEGSVDNNDIAVIDFEGFKDGVAFEGGKGENYSLTIGSGSFIPGFEEQLIGMNKDEEKDIEVTFPEEYHSEDLKGKKVTFKVRINEIKTVRIPELDSDFFLDLGMDGIDSEESFRKEIEETIRVRKEAENEDKYIDELLKELSSVSEIDVPHVMTHEEAHRMVHQYEDRLRMQGLTLEQFFKITNSNEEQLAEKMHEEAENRVKYRLLLEEIIKLEKIEITKDKAEEEASLLAEKYRMEKDEFLKEMGGLDMIKYDLSMRAALDILKGKNDKE